MKKSLLSLAMLPGFVFAEVQLDTQVVEVNRIEASKLANSTVITREQIAATQSPNLTDLLETLPGFQITKNGGLGQEQGFFLNGYSSDQVLFLINGKRVGSATLGEVQFHHIPTTSIERIEIVSNARSSVFGADALGGVINIVTKQGAVKTNNIRAAVGNQNTTQLSANVGQSLGDLAFNLSAFTERTKGYDVYKPKDDDRDGSERHSADLGVDYKVNASNSISFQAQQNRGTVDYDGRFGGPGQKSDYIQQVLGLDWDLQTDNFNSTLSIGKSSDSSWNYGDGTSRSDADAFITKRDSAEFTSLYAINKQNDLMLVADYRKEDVGESDSEYDKTESTTKGAGISHRFTGEKLQTELGARYDDAQRYDAKSSYSVSVGYLLMDGLEVVIAQNTGFQAPSFNDLYFPDSAFSVGNPDLKPEESENTRLAVNYDYSAGSVEVSYQQSEIKNLIAWNPDSTGKYTPSNVSTANIDTVQVNWNGQLSEAFSTNLGFEWLDTEDEDTGNLLARRAPRVFKAGVAYNLNKLSTSLNGQHVAAHYDDSDNETDIAAYTVLSAAANWKFNERFSTGVRINNLTNRSYETVSDYRAQGRLVLLNGQFNF